MAIVAQRLIVEVRGDISDAEDKLDKVGAKSDGVGSKLGGLGKAAVAAGGAFAVGFGVKSVMAASDVEESLSKVNTIFGTSGVEIDKWAQGAAADFGMSRAVALDTAGSLGNMFTQLGIGVGEASKMSQGITELAADFASFHNADISEVISAQSAAFRGEYDSLQRFLPLINAATVEQKAMEMTGKANAKALTAQEKALAVHELMLSGAGKAAGDFDRTSASLANQMRIMKARAENFASSVGSVLLPIMMRGLDLFGKLGGIVKDFVAPAFDAIRDVFREVARHVEMFTDALKDGADPVEAFAEIADHLLGNTGNLIPIFTAVGGAIEKVVGFVKANAQPILIGVAAAIGAVLVPALWAWVAAQAAAVAGAVVAAAPFIAIGLAIAALVIGLKTAYERFEVFRNIVAAVVDFVTGTIAPLLQQFAENLIGWLGGAVDWVVKIWPQISEAVGHVFNVIKTLVAVVLGPTLLAIKFLWETIGDDVMRIVRAAFKVVGEVINAVLDVFRGVVQFVLAIINGDWSKAWNSAMAIVRGIWDAFFGFLRGIGDTVKSIIGGLLSILSGALEAAFKGGIAILTGLPGWIIGAVGDVAGAVVGIGRNVVEGIWNGINAAKTWLIQKLKDFIGDAIPGPIKSVLSIFSPSRVTAGLGEEVAKGLALGIQRRTGLVAAAAGNLASAAVPELGGAAGPSPSLVGAGGGGLSLSITVNGAGDPRGTAEAVTDAGRALVADLLRELRSR